MILAERAMGALPVVIGTLAVAGLVHFGTVLAFPNEVEDDSFVRVAALAPVGAKTPIPADRSTRLPFQDAAMTTVVCRYDLGNGPFSIVVPAFADSFLSFGFYDRRGRAFSGLNLQANSDGSTTLLLLTGDQKAASDAAGEGGDGDRTLAVVAPGPEGFALIEAPSDNQAALDALTCGSSPNG